MPSEDADEIRHNRISEAKVRLRSLFGIETETQFLRPAWGEINFSGVIDEWKRNFIPILKMLVESDLNFIPQNDFPNLVRYIDSIEQSLTNISNFNIASGNAIQFRNELQSNLRRSINEFLEYVRRYSLLLIAEKLESEKLDLARADILNEAKLLITSLEETTRQAAAQKVEVDTILEGARAATGKIGVERHSQIFSNQSRKMFWSSMAWLAATIFVTIGSASFAWYLYNHPNFALGDITIALQIVVAKVVFLGMLVTATVWCGKNYRALAHEASVNKHRANALATFRTFVDATDEPEIRNAVLLEATRSIFSQAPSGFLDKGDQGSSDTRILEVVRSLSASLPRGGH